MALKSFTDRLSMAAWKSVGLFQNLDIQYDRPIRSLNGRQTILPISIAMFLFFYWGFAYGLLDLMNFYVRQAMGLRREVAAFLAAGYYAAYIPGPLLLSGPLVRTAGYRITFVVGLTVFGFGNFIIAAGADRENFGGMVAGMFVIGLGVSTLERSANPYVVNCGPRNQGTRRILLAQGMAGVGTIVAPLVGKKFLFEAEVDAPATTPEVITSVVVRATQSLTRQKLESAIQLYRAVGGIVLASAFVFVLIFFRTWWVPEAPQYESPKTNSGWKVWKHPIVSMRYSRLWWAVLSNFFNMGCQVAFAQFFIEHLKTNANTSAAKGSEWLSVAQTAFVAGRFAAAVLAFWPKVFKPRLVLFTFIAGAIAFTAASAYVKSGIAIAYACMVMFCEAPSFPMIFESADVGLGEWSSLGETFMIVSISGGALQPPLFGKLANSVGISQAWWLTAGAFGVVWSYCWANNLIPSYRRALDKGQCEEDHAESCVDQEAVGAYCEPKPPKSMVTISAPASIYTPEGRTYFGRVA